MGDKAPDVFPMISSCKGSPTSPKVSVACLVLGYFPEPVTMQWKKDSGTISTDVKNFPSVLDLSKGLFTTSTQLTIPAASMSSHTYSCIVDHPKTKAHITKTIPGAGTAPTVRVLHSSCSVPSKDNNIELVCLISNFDPLTVTVDWLVDGISGLVKFSTTTPRKNEDGKTYSTTSQANITQEEWLQGKTYTCEVTHSATATKKRDHARRCPVSTQAASDIQVYVVPPSPGDLYVKQSPELICMVINLPSNEAPKVTWTKDSPGVLNAKPLQWVEQSNGTYTATRALPIFTPDWEKRQKFTCKVEHPELPSPLTKTISKKTGKQSAPGVYVFGPHHDELNSKENSVSITCLVRGFLPEDVSVQWMHDQNPMDDRDYATTAPMKDTAGDSPFFLYSKLRVSKDRWNRGEMFTCMVVHEALPMKFIQKSVRKQPEVFVPADMCSYDKDEEMEGVWATISVFITLFLLSVCYSATVTLFKVKWLFSTVVQLKQANTSDYKNVIQHAV
ncbi:hypothetical protein Y1Q_0005956 [Alligator mississippiensis]|uniref:Ig-like domain-containing protein n=1 Tax=Alligator mississippiensis TaxID=8496 RepID=A0A151MZ64_ALLMI|nr:hypothetical protein Y1Q_0005956 [Alligator mississippiensis]